MQKDHKPHIIIADDHILFRDTLVTYLGAARPLTKIYTAGNFIELFTLLDKYKDKIDLMLVDYAMPNMMSREAFLGLIREYKSIPLVMMSGVAEPQDIEFIK